eukprot:Protomagalhaensia_wolfi_Nauph_80__1306@NODE_177_length_3287_cov_73_133005_g128_i1_p2_GENE_NODE_177_length_3287_cov_73_133005_g128_i1NODE_177_length_3287_cov_73_133005_g128_i1_p2_ORF_typecomplete_len317_score51_67_NODE_177_length_3287_cov_73_133005_g128_i129952
MGCVQSVPADEPVRETKPPPTKTAQPKDEMPSYMTADPDLGWRNITEATEYYPTLGFDVDFQNERSGNVLKRMNLFVLSINIAERASKLANRYGVTDNEGFQSSSNLLEDLARQQGRTDETNNSWGANIDKDMRKVLKTFGCPHFGWQLKCRKFPTAPLMKQSPEIFLSGEGAPPGGESHDDLGQAPGRALLNELASVPPFLQEVSGSDHKLYLLDISEIAINIAEQLFRLEKSETSGHRIPNESFGWKLIKNPATTGPTPPQPLAREAYAIPVANPEGEALMVIPEELIMHVASWVQQTYLTAPAF